MINVNVSLSETLLAYVDEQVVLSGYGTVSEYLCELIRDDKKRKAQDRLETFLLEGLESGDAVLVTPEFWKELWARADARKRQGMAEG